MVPEEIADILSPVQLLLFIIYTHSVRTYKMMEALRGKFGSTHPHFVRKYSYLVDIKQQP